MSDLRFLGATGTVTGSKFLLRHDGFTMLVDCGLFQGMKELRLRNWSTPPFDPRELDLVVLTHAHLDHSGYLPVLAQRGYEGEVLATDATVDLCGILLPDAGHIQEEDARFANKRGFSRHRPALPLFDQAQARATLKQLRSISCGKPVQVHDSIDITLHPAGHILGAAFVEVRLRSKGGDRVVLFSGDLGRPSRPIIPDPTPLPRCNHLVLESTYGNRDHPTEDPKEGLARVIRSTAERGGVVLIPAFSVGRTQTLLFLLRELQDENRLPRDIPVHVDSPMAIHATRIFMKHREAHDTETSDLLHNGDDPLGLRHVHLDSEVQESKALNDLRYPAIIISASGMATGGRVLHHLAYRLGDHRTTVMFVGFQAAGTRGRALQDGAKRVKIHGAEVPVRARIETLDGLSAHADRGEIIRWLTAAEELPRSIHLVHGEPAARSALAGLIRERTGRTAREPEFLEKVSV
jgi:metallo-beta-lactamase family protein